MNDKNLEGVHYESDTHDKSPMKEPNSKKSEKKKKETEEKPVSTFSEAVLDGKKAGRKQASTPNHLATKSPDPFDRDELLRKFKANKSKARPDTVQGTEEPIPTQSISNHPPEVSESADMMLSPSSHAKVGLVQGANATLMNTFSFHTSNVECEATREPVRPVSYPLSQAATVIDSKDVISTSKRPMISGNGP
mmetsp:Transcript_11978/g.18500  ORF Transcript_11978/g.18500 Transcript_11978/m.18500 type:complete len:193 (-) Transcript_11978:1199-1777(-)